MPHLIATEAIVLRKRELLHKDMIVTLFSREMGKLGAIAKGIKKITSRRAPHLQTGNLVKLQLNRSHETHYIQSTELISGFTGIKDSPEKTSHMYFIFFILDRLLPEGQPEEGPYVLIKNFLVTLARSESFESEDVKNYLFRLLFHLGYVQEHKSLKELIRLTEEIIHEKIPYHII